MKVSLKAPTEHTIRILQYINSHAGEKLTTKEIAEEMQLTSSYVMKLVSELKRAGILESVQGRYGGFYLRKPPEKITMLEILDLEREEALPLAAVEGFDAKPAKKRESCGNRLEHVLTELGEVMSQYLGDVTLADIERL